MARKESGKRGLLVETAAELVYRRGFGDTALADIAREADVPLGNIYYYFKTKKEIGEAIIAKRTTQVRGMCEAWDMLDSPKKRLYALVDLTIGNSRNLAQSGCPVGSLCSEVQKGDAPLGKEAAQPLAVLLRWIETQFAALGKNRQKKILSLHLLAALQGISLLAHGFEDADLVVLEGDHLKRWIAEL
jgi:AcrR family transcriptional regulator